jgi:hypothetical protein
MTALVWGICSIVLANTRKIIPKNKSPKTTANLNIVFKRKKSRIIKHKPAFRD